MWAKIITIKRTKDLNYISLCALNLFNTQVSQFELNYWNKFKSNNFLLSHHHSTSALVSEILMSVLQTVQKKQQFTYGQYIFTDCTEDNVQNTHTYTQYT